MAVAGCTTVSDGTARVNAGDAPAYRTSVSVSASESAASSSARESERQASETTKAMHDTCETLSTTSADAIDAVNAYVDAFNQGAGNVDATEGPAVDALNQSADAVEGSMSDVIPPELKDALTSLGRRRPRDGRGHHRQGARRGVQPEHRRPQRHEVQRPEPVRRDVLRIAPRGE